MNNSENKLISVVGPTGVGKTSFTLALVEHLRHKFPGQFGGFDIISADSRQIYQDLSIISGADVPEDFVQHNGETVLDRYFESGQTRIYGLLALDYRDEWSVAHFKEFAKVVISRSWESGRLPIIVGGTGLYHEHLFNLSPTLDIKPNLELRRKLADLSVDELQETLRHQNLPRFLALNESDVKNPTRLLRAIEISDWEKQAAENRTNFDSDFPETSTLPAFAHLTLGLKAELEVLEAKIMARVEERLAQGAISEVERLSSLAEEYGPNKQLLSATGVKEIMAYLAGAAEKTEVSEKWAKREFQYAKRQITWWKKKTPIEWFEIATEKWQSQAFLAVDKFILPS